MRLLASKLNVQGLHYTRETSVRRSMRIKGSADSVSLPEKTQRLRCQRHLSHHGTRTSQPLSSGRYEKSDGERQAHHDLVCPYHGPSGREQSQMPPLRPALSISRRQARWCSHQDQIRLNQVLDVPHKVQTSREGIPFRHNNCSASSLL
jgi:hypothetical protein